MTEAFAAVNHRKEIIVNTVSATRRAAMVNWLVAVDHQPIYQSDTDEEIERQFRERAMYRGMASIEPVTVTILHDEGNNG